jgi:hypothetical protein
MAMARAEIFVKWRVPRCISCSMRGCYICSRRSLNSPSAIEEMNGRHSVDRILFLTVKCTSYMYNALQGKIRVNILLGT